MSFEELSPEQILYIIDAMQRFALIALACVIVYIFGNVLITYIKYRGLKYLEVRLVAENKPKLLEFIENKMDKRKKKKEDEIYDPENTEYKL